MPISRRQFSSLLAAAPALLQGRQTSSQAARIKLDTDRVVGDIDPKIYGNFIEHLGRCIDGGIFEEVAALRHRRLSQGRAGRRAEAERHPPALAGRQFLIELQLEGRHRTARPASAAPRDGVGYRREQSLRHPRIPGLHSRIGTEPYICTNLGTGTWNEAQQWVEYCQLRRRHGHDPPAQEERPPRAPWKVTYWGLGNEMDGPWQMGHRSAEDYGKFALEAAKLMKWTDPSVKLIAAGSSNFGPASTGPAGTAPCSNTSSSTSTTCRCTCTSAIAENDYGDFHGESRRTRERIKITEGIIARPSLSGPTQQPQDLYRLGRMERLVSRRGDNTSAAAESWRSTTTSKTRWWLRAFSIPSSTTPTS